MGVGAGVTGGRKEGGGIGPAVDVSIGVGVDVGLGVDEDIGQVQKGQLGTWSARRIRQVITTTGYMVAKEGPTSTNDHWVHGRQGGSVK